MSQLLIPAPNFTQIPNVIFDYWMKILSPADFKILLCICRKTFGWHKKADEISIQQLEKMSGLSKQGILDCLNSLSQKNLVLKSKTSNPNGGDGPSKYELNIISNKVSGVNSVDPGSQLSVPPPVNSVDPGGVNSVDPQKKDLTKENLNIDIAQTPKGASQVIEKICFSIEKREFENISDQDMQTWKEIYSLIDIPLQLKKMAEWLLANGSKGNKRLWRKFITNWLNNANEKALIQQAKTFQSNNGTNPSKPTNPNEQSNLEAFRKVCEHLRSKNRAVKMSLRGKYIYEASGDSISLELPPETFEEIICKWNNLQAKR